MSTTTESPLIASLRAAGWGNDPMLPVGSHTNDDGATYFYFGGDYAGDAMGGAVPTHLVTVFDTGRGYDGWDITKLDKWGGTGSRAPMAQGDLDTLAEMFARCDRLTRRQHIDPVPRPEGF